ncbi:MAG TPA: tetratricopeptide repeat protein [Longimicrobium sp.]|nr:tetratricopeptide repeat protein [Longimicrobium sp.]
MRKLQLAAALLGLAAATPALHAQRVHAIPARPALWAGADTNSANVYYLWAMQRVENDPAQAAAAFYWAERLNPGWADALYGRRMALMLANPQRLADYVEGKGYTQRDPELLAIDSLLLRASQRSPFLYTALEKPFWMAYYRTVYRDAVRRYTGQDNAADAEYLLQRDMADMEPALRAWHDYSAGRFGSAAQAYEAALRRDSRSFGLRLRLGHARYMAGDYRGAAQSIAEAITQRRDDDRRQVVRLYESKAILEFSRATALEQAGDTAASREALGRALEEDLSFWPVHRELAARALEHGDTATAMAEMALAVELAPNEADLRFGYAVLLLVQPGKALQGVAELSRAIELDPYFAEPHYLLAALNDQAQIPEDAAAHYRHFMERAARDDARRATAQQRLAALDAPAAPTAP